jgi:SAM-dependent methyltransferase
MERIWEKVNFGTYHHTDYYGSQKTRERVASLFDRAFSYIDNLGFRPKFILDAGSGLGFIAALLCLHYGGAEVFAADNYTDSSMVGGGIPAARKNIELLGLGGRVHLTRCDLRMLPVVPGKFDLACTNLVYHNMGSESDSAVRELFNAVRNGGFLLFGDLFFSESFYSSVGGLKILLELRVSGRYLSKYRLLLVEIVR